MFPDFNRLKIFYLIYTNKSISDAARVLNISQPAVSQQLKKLEKELRIPLFTRANKRLIPTPAATRLHDKIAPFIQELQDEISYLRRPLDTPYGRLTVGASELFGRQLLPTICSHFRFRFPTVTFSLHLADNDTLLAGLKSDSFDIVLLDLKNTSAGNNESTRLFTFENIFSEELILVGSTTYCRRKITAQADYEALRSQEFLQTELTAPLLDQWFRINFKRAPENLSRVMWSNDLQVIVNGMKSGMGLAILPFHMVKNEIEAGRVTVISPRHRQLTRALVLTTIKNKKASLTQKAFTKILEKELKKMQAPVAASGAGIPAPDTAQ